MGFFPARMTRLLVGGHKQHLAGVIEALHAEGAVHLEDYEDPTGTTAIGSPLPAGANASEQLVKVRGLLKALAAEDVAPAGPVDAGHTLAQAEQATTAIVDRANAHRADWVALETEEATLAPYRGLDIELSALTGLTSVKVYVGQARSDPSAALAAAGVSAESQAAPSPAGFAVAAIVATRDAAAAEKALQASGFAAAALPAGRSGTPALRLAAIAAEKSRLQSALASSEADLANLRAEWAPRLASAEAALSTEVEKTQAPLKFGVTATTFHVEGWLPRTAANRVKNALAAKFGDSLYVEDLGDAPRHETAHATGGSGNGPAHGHAARPSLASDTHGSVPAAAAGMPIGHETDSGDHSHEGADAHHAVDPADEPPIHLENPKPARPYEWMLSLLASPRYGEIDPSKLMLVFFPLFFGLMVGDVIVGAAIIAFGWFLKTHKVIGIGGPAVGRALMAGGLMSVIIGAFVFGEALGIHFVVGPDQEHEGEMSWEQILGLHIPFETEEHGFFYKTGSPEAVHAIDTGGHEVVPVDEGGHADAAPTETPVLTPHAESTEPAAGILTPAHHTHLSAGGIVNLGYYSKLADALALLVWSLIIGALHIILGLLLGVRNVWAAHGFTLAIQEKGAWLTLMGGAALAALGSGMLFYVGIGVVVASLALLWMGAAKVLGQGFIALLEIPSLIGNMVSYTRLAAIGASKAGLGLALGVICFETLGGGAVGWTLYVVLFVGIILLAVLSAGLQSLRLQFVEFFGKFYTGGGRPYVPFGRRAT